jgi:hypothetical protein
MNRHCEGGCSSTPGPSSLDTHQVMMHVFPSGGAHVFQDLGLSIGAYGLYVQTRVTEFAYCIHY